MDTDARELLDDPRAITRPDPALNTYYLISSLAGLIFFPFIYVPLLLRYRTLRYRFDEAGVAMSWGQFNQREIYLTYRRIQDIEVRRGLLQRWLGLANLQLQTSSGGSGAGGGGGADEALALLREIRDELRLLREAR